MWNFIKRNKWLVSGSLVFVTLISVLGVSIGTQTPLHTRPLTIGQGSVVLRIGTEVDASSTVDYVCDGTNDNVQFQGALDALPANGGEIDILSGNYSFGATVTRAIPNVTIRGVGKSTYLAYNAGTAIFTAGGNNWSYSNFRVDTTTAQLVTSMAATTLWSWENISTSDGYTAYRTASSTTASSWNIPTGRTASYVIAASDAPANVKAQADAVCDGTADEIQINAAIQALPAGGGRISLTNGTFNMAEPIVIDKPYVALVGENNGGGIAGGTVIYAASAINQIVIGNAGPAKLCGILISTMLIRGSGAGNGCFGIKAMETGITDQMRIFDVSVFLNEWAIDEGGDATHMDHLTILYNTNGIHAENVYSKISNSEISDNAGIGISSMGRVVDCTLVRNGTYNIAAARIVENCQVGESPGIGIAGTQIVVGNQVWANLTNIQSAANNQVISSNYIHDGTAYGIQFVGSQNCTISGNTLKSNIVGLQIDYSSLNNTFIGNNLISNTTQVYVSSNSLGNTFSANKGYVGKGEVQTISGTLAGVTPAGIMSSIDNPFGQAVRVLSVDIEVTTQGAASGTMCVGVGSSATADYETIFHVLPCDNGTTYPYLFNSHYTATYGVQTNPINWATGGGNRYLNFYAHVANAAYAATYTITCMGN